MRMLCYAHDTSPGSSATHASICKKRPPLAHERARDSRPGDTFYKMDIGEPCIGDSDSGAGCESTKFMAAFRIARSNPLDAPDWHAPSEHRAYSLGWTRRQSPVTHRGLDRRGFCRGDAAWAP